MPIDRPMDETLRLARDLCLGVGAFFVTEAGTVFSDVSDVMRPDNADARVHALARSCLSHPAARGSGLFWSAESTDEGSGTPPEWSLGCVVASVWDHNEWLGLLGVVDVWLPELDNEQRAGLLALAAAVGAPKEPEVPAANGSRTPAEAATTGAQPPAALTPAAGHLAEAATAGAGPVAGGSASGGEPFVGEVLDHLPDGLVVARSDGTIVLVNQTFSDLTGLPMDTVLGEDAVRLLAPATGFEQGVDRDAAVQSILGAPGSGREVRVATGAADAPLLEAVGRRVDSRFAGDCYVTLVRAAHREAAGRTAQPEQVGIQVFLDHIEDGIVCCDAQGTVVVANRAARRLQGLTDQELQVGATLPSLVRLLTVEGHPLSVDEHPLVRSMLDDVPVTTEFLLLEGELRRYVSISSHPLRVDGGDGAIAVLRDVTAERERQAHLTHYALHDPLTGAANRYLLIDALRRMLDGLTRRGGFVSLIYLDLDRFKDINDEHGHDTGDGVLRAMALRLERAVRGEDVVARLGGDEFVVAHVTEERLSDGDAVVARLRKVLSAPYRFGDLVLDVAASVGWVSTSSGDETPESLIARADRAMYEHKNQRRVETQEAVR